jgi:hypothetical protein
MTARMFAMACCWFCFAVVHGVHSCLRYTPQSRHAQRQKARGASLLFAYLELPHERLVPDHDRGKGHAVHGRLGEPARHRVAHQVRQRAPEAVPCDEDMAGPEARHLG